MECHGLDDPGEPGCEGVGRSGGGLGPVDRCLQRRLGATAILPAPQEILDALWSIREEVPTLCGEVLARAWWGLLLGGVPGIVVGLVFGYSRWARERFLFYVDVLRLIPPLALYVFLAPFFVLVDGFTTTRPGVAVVTVGVLPIVAI